MLHLPSFLLILSASSTSAASSESAQFASLLSARDPPEDLARELLSLIEDDAFSRAAKVMVGAETFHAAATADAFNTVVGHATSPLTYLLDQWSRAIDFKWPAPVMHGALFDAAIAFGATGGGDACAVLTAARTRNVGALRALLYVTPSRDVTACLLNTTRANLFAFASSSPSPGTARLFFRGGRVAIGASNTSAEAAAAMLALRDSDGVLFSPSLWPTAFKSALEAASPPVELDLLAPFFGVGFTGEAPRPDSGDAEAHLDAMWAAAEDGAPLPSVWAHRASAQDLLMARDPGTGATPILKACASGRTAVLARLLALLPNSVTPSSDALHGSPAFGGATCAHLAAASGDAKTLATLTARFPNAISDALHGRDAHGRTPCDIAAAGGGLLAPATVFLRDAGACGDTAIKVESLAHCPIVQRLDDRPELAVAARGFDVREHVLGGWRMLSPSDLASLSLPPTFLSQNTLDEYERHGRTLLRDSMLRRGARRGNTTEDLETESPRFAFACDPSELPASALREDPTTVDALVRDFISTQTPFVVRAAYDPGEALSTDDGPHSGVPTIHRVYDAFTNLMVDTGEHVTLTPPYVGAIKCTRTSSDHHLRTPTLPRRRAPVRQRVRARRESHVRERLYGTLHGLLHVHQFEWNYKRGCN